MRPSSASLLAQAAVRGRLEVVVGVGFADGAFETELVTGDRQRRQSGELVSPRDRVVERPKAMDTTGGVQLFSRVGLRREQHRASDRRGELRCESPDRPVVDHETEFRRRDPDRARRRGDPQVGGDRELGACTQRRSVDRCDHRDGQTTEATQHRGEIGGELALLDSVEIRTGAERRWLAGQHDGANCIRAARLDPSLDVEQFQERRAIDGVAPRRPIERDDRDESVVSEIDRHDPKRRTRSMTRLYVELADPAR